MKMKGWIISIMIFVAMIGISFGGSFIYNSWEFSERDVVVTGFENLIIECNAIHDVQDWNEYVDNINTFIDEYGQFNEYENDMEITSGDSKINSLIDELNECEYKQEKLVDIQLQSELDKEDN